MFTGTLHPFQLEAKRRMVKRQKLLVAYEMGLGKTVITIAALEDLIEMGRVSHGLLIVLSSLKYQWLHQLEKFSDAADVIVIDGTPQQRTAQYDAFRGGYYDYAILNYEQVVNDWQQVKTLPRDFVVLDEATYIKGFRAQRSQYVKKLYAEYQYALSGQPVENRPEEVFSIMEFVDDEVLGRFDIFDRSFIVRNKSFGSVKHYKNLHTLHKRLDQAMVRKTRDDPEVKPFLPDIIPDPQYIRFDHTGATLYNYIAADLLDQIAKAIRMFGSFDLWAHYGHGNDSSNQVRGLIMSRLTCLRMLCDHPNLLKISAKAYGNKKTSMGSRYAYDLSKVGKLDGLKSSPKLNHMIEYIDDRLQASKKNKIVVFSFFKPMLRLLQESTPKLTRSVLFTGDQNAKQRDTAKSQFEKDPKTRLFLSSDAGGYGVDLPFANYLANFDLPWSAGKIDQRESRIVRMSSEFESVSLTSMMMFGSVEERQYDMLDQKRKISGAVIDGKGYDAKGKLTLDLESLSSFLMNNSV